MKNLLIYLAIVSFFAISISAKPVSLNLVEKIGYKFAEQKFKYLPNKSSSNETIKLDLVYKTTYQNQNSNLLNSNEVYFYIFNINNSGFVIISGDDAVSPILAYSNEGNFDPNNIPINTKLWLDNYKKQIKFAIENNIQASFEVKSKWMEYLSGNNEIKFEKNSVIPIIQSKWNQAPFYNELCPGGSVTGCVATAMAQVMKYWNYPPKGVFSHSYNHSVYGNLSANFGKTTYQWDSMPNSINKPNIYVATLNYHCGVSVDMGYSPSGSGAYMELVGPALKTYFSYKGDMRNEYRNNYTDSAWISLLKTDLDSARPILYAGYGNVGGHAFICDGYDNEDYFHFNWGWGGASDGYFIMSALLGEAGNGFNAGQMAIINVRPPVTNDSLKYELEIAEKITCDNALVEYQKAFSCKTNIRNKSKIDFIGDIGVMIFDEQERLIDSVQVFKGIYLKAGEVSPFPYTFYSQGLNSLLPGIYYLSVYYRANGTNWVEVNSNDSITNSAKIKVFNPLDFIELDSPMDVTNGTILTQRIPATVRLNIKNTGTTTFIGQYQLALYDLKGQFCQMIKQIDEEEGLEAGGSYKFEYLEFTCKKIVVPPGTYYMTLQHKSKGSPWKLTASQYYQNPIKVIVREPAIPADKYEQNDSLSVATIFAPSFINNEIEIISDTATFHKGNDLDYYKLVLPLGYKYLVDVKMYDYFNNNDDNSFTGDGLISYSLDAKLWSEPYEDTLALPIELDGGGDINLLAVPYLPDRTGSYQLIFNIKNLGTSNIFEEDNSELTVFPNPATDKVNIGLKSQKARINRIFIRNILGEIVFENYTNNNNEQIALKDLNRGIYFIIAETSIGNYKCKLIVK